MIPKDDEPHNVLSSDRRGFLARAAGAASVTLLANHSHAADPSSADADGVQVIDFNRSFGHYVAEQKGNPIWVRVELECRCEVFDRSTQQTDEYYLSVRTQTGLRTDPLSDTRDPGYDFWYIFSKQYVYIRRTLASSYGNSSARVPYEDFTDCDWHIERVPSTPLTSGFMIRDALRSWKRVVARTEFNSADGTRGFVVEYPVKWADGNDDGTFRVETGPIILLDPERAQVGQSPEMDDFQWSYLDYRSLDRSKVFLEQPTPVLAGTQWDFPGRQQAPVTPAQRSVIEQRLYSGWNPPIPVEDLRKVFMRNHYSTAEQRTVTTQLFSMA